MDIGFYDDPAMTDPSLIGKYRERFELSETSSGSRLNIHSGPVSKQDSMDQGVLWDGALARIGELAESNM